MRNRSGWDDPVAGSENPLEVNGLSSFHRD